MIKLGDLLSENIFDDAHQFRLMLQKKLKSKLPAFNIKKVSDDILLMYISPQTKDEWQYGIGNVQTVFDNNYYKLRIQKNGTIDFFGGDLHTKARREYVWTSISNPPYFKGVAKTSTDAIQLILKYHKKILKHIEKESKKSSGGIKFK